MPAKALLDVDLRIARLRDDMASGKATLNTGIELDQLIQERTKLLEKIAKLKEQEAAAARI